MKQSHVSGIAITATLLWGAGVLSFTALHPQGGLSVMTSGPLSALLFLFMILAPIGFLWWGVALKIKLDSLFDDFAQLNRKMGSLGKAGHLPQTVDDSTQNGSVPSIFETVNMSLRKVEDLLVELKSTGETQVLLKNRAAKIHDDIEQPKLALGSPSEDLALPLLNSELVRALNFPDNEKDARGFVALKRARQNRASRDVLQSSQDLLTMLSQNGIYMDDLRPDRAQPDVWRRFARGERGSSVAVLGGIRDRSSLALSAGRLREDAEFRQTAHHFLHQFDQMLQSFEQKASDEDMTALSNTRSARAFMLLGRATGVFGP